MVRVDPKHRPLHQFFKEEFAEPLGQYTTVTIAMYMNELIKRVDPKHRPLHQFFKEEFAEPLGKYTQSP